MTHEIILNLNEQEYTALIAAAAENGKQPEALLRDMIRRLQKTDREKQISKEQELEEKLFREGKIERIPERRPLTPEELAEREKLGQAFSGGKPMSEMVIEDRGPY